MKLEGMTSEEAREEINDIYNNPSHPYHDEDDPDHDWAIGHVEDLHSIANREDGEDLTTGQVKTREELKEMMADPRYETDPEYRAEVDEEYKKAFPDEEESEEEYNSELEPYRRETMRALQEEWGEETDGRIDDATDGLLEISHETGIDLVPIVDSPVEMPDGRIYRMGNDPLVIKVFEAIGRKLKNGEDSMAFDFNNVDINDEEQVKDARLALRKMLDDPRYEKDGVYRNRVTRLYQKFYPGKVAAASSGPGTPPAGSVIR